MVIARSNRPNPALELDETNGGETLARLANRCDRNVTSSISCLSIHEILDGIGRRDTEPQLTRNATAGPKTSKNVGQDFEPYGVNANMLERDCAEYEVVIFIGRAPAIRSFGQLETWLLLASHTPLKENSCVVKICASDIGSINPSKLFRPAPNIPPRSTAEIERGPRWFRRDVPHEEVFVVWPNVVLSPRARHKVSFKRSWENNLRAGRALIRRFLHREITVSRLPGSYS